ncbi:MAG: DUF1707 domain-containing protein [Lapillicoccus sp.]
MTDPGGLRVGHHEREATIAVLRSAAGEGRLTSGELAQRIDTTLAARTFADLDDVVSDLPVARPSTELLRPAPYDPSLAGMDPDHRRQITAGMSSYVERGVWVVPPYLFVRAGAGSVRLDFLQAICPHPVVDIAVSGGLGSVTLVLPLGWGANLDQVGKGMGSLSNKVSSVAEPGQPLLILHGTSGIGSIRVRYANWLDRRRLRRALRATANRPRLPAGTGPLGLPGNAPAPQPGPGGRSSEPQDAPPRDAPG